MTTKKADKNILDWIAFILVVVGGLNWGLIGCLHFDLVAAIFGNMSMISRVVYSLVGISAIYAIYRAISKNH